jgi:hypothetical protein
LKENVIIGRLIPARYKPLSEMVPAPVAALEEVLDKMDEEVSIVPEETPKLDMSVDDDEDDLEAEAAGADDEADMKADKADEIDAAEE